MRRFEEEKNNAAGKGRMNYDAFCQFFKNAISEQCNGTANVKLNYVEKNNGVQYVGLVVKSDESNIAPNIYLDSFYREYLEGEDMNNLTGKFWELYENNRYNGNFDVSFFTDYARSKNRIVPRLVNYEKNKEVLKNRPFRRWLDLAITYSCSVNNDKCMSSISICNEHLKFWGVDEPELYKIAMENMLRIYPPVVRNFMSCIMGKENEYIAENMSVPMYVLSNSVGQYGAAAVLCTGVVKQISDKAGHDIWLIPSSVHEFLALTDMEDENGEMLREMVREVNSTAVASEEVLSENVYRYNRALDCIELAE